MIYSGKSVRHRGMLLRALMSTAALLAPLSANSAFAQEDTQVEEVVVTSSRIVREGYNAPTPLSVIGQEQIETNAGANLATFVTTLPAFVGSASARSSTVTGNSGIAGINSLNLRGLGPTRTLTLIDGRRMTPAHQNGSVDASLVPQQLVARVDVVTGGASAVYGSDAITGVVNFVLDKTFTGIRGEVSGGITHYGDGENFKVALSGGTPFAGGRGHLLLSGEIVRDAGIRTGPEWHNQKRNWMKAGVQNIINPLYAPGNGQPQRLMVQHVGYATAAPGGVIVGGPLAGLAFGEGGVPYQQDMGLFSNPGSVPWMVGGDWKLNDVKPFNDIAPEEKRENIFARVSYDITDSVNVYGQFSAVRSYADADAVHGLLPTNSGPLIQRDNAYLPESVRARMVAANITNFRLGVLNRDLGPFHLETDRRTTTWTIGATGEFGAMDAAWVWDIYAQKGVTDAQVDMKNNLSKQKYYLATDAVVNPATGAIVCRVTLTDPNYQSKMFVPEPCRPYNPFGYNLTTADDPGQQFIHEDALSHVDISQEIFGASIRGEPFNVWAGPVSVAFSAEHRRDKTDIEVDVGSYPNVDHVFGNFNPLHGRTNVSEIAAEVVVPITTDDSGLGKIDVNAGVRGTKYSYFGKVATWKIGATYDPFDQLTIRVTRSRDIRAPNHLEAFTPASAAFSNTFDPFTNTQPQIGVFTRGNTDLVPEKADTLGLGAVVRPSFLPGFTASVDYWDIQMKEAIDTISATNVLNLCFDGSRPDLCQFIERNAAGVLQSVTIGQINLSERNIRGVDYEASYRTDLGFAPGSVSLHANATNYLKDYSESPVIEPLDNVGVITGAVKWRYTGSITYNLEPFTSTLTIRGHSGGKINNRYFECKSACPASTPSLQTVNENDAPGIFYLDFSATYDLNILGRESSVFLNIRNLENKPHPNYINTNANFNNGNIATAYDVDGRVYRIGLRFRM